MKHSKRIIQKLEYIARLDTGRAGDEHHPISPALLEQTQQALLGVHTSGTKADQRRYDEVLTNVNVQRVLGLRKEI